MMQEFNTPTEKRAYVDSRGLTQAIENEEVVLDKNNLLETAFSILRWADTHPDEKKLALCANWIFMRVPDVLNYTSIRKINFPNIMKNIFEKN